MFGGHKECEEKLHTQNLSLVNQIQELKAINNYQTIELEQKIAALEREIESNQQLYDEEYKKNIRLHERLDSFQTDNDSLKQQLECSQREVSTLSGVLNSEPIMEALGVKSEVKHQQGGDGITHYDKDAQ